MFLWTPHQSWNLSCASFVGFVLKKYLKEACPVAPGQNDRWKSRSVEICFVFVADKDGMLFHRTVRLR